MIELNLQTFGTGPALVLIHGWAMNSMVWKNLLDELKKTYQIICVELPGHGKSQYAEAWQLDDLLPSLAKQLPERCSILGWSLGGMVSLAYADRYPSRVDKLIMLASSAKFVQSKGWSSAQPMETLTLFSHGLMGDSFTAIRRFLMLQTQGVGSSKKLNLLLRDVLKMGGEASKNGLKSGLDILQYIDLRAALKNIKLPVLMIMGGKDQLVPAAAGKASLEINESIDLTVIEDASHVPFLSHPSDVLKAIKQFIPYELSEK
ncbi:MAG: pimeloyl-ACP methyl ester esterase BioH [Cycloclasticus sp.]|nr:pimeloyl-ACP methyl ester esterase BioH [Cycloclasticus sp.]MBQ0789743.1 pimeloyl-ACP methyl ester esterase BioH [Cycloclasticus sp.]